jgi:hypothetical protein
MKRKLDEGLKLFLRRCSLCMFVRWKKKKKMIHTQNRKADSQNLLCCQ